MIFKGKDMAVMALILALACGQYAVAAEDMAGMDMSGAGNAAGMQGGSAPANARDPHAYSGGYHMGMSSEMKMADEAVMAGVMINRLERIQARDHTYFNAYDLQGRVGKDYDRLVVKAEGEVDEGKIHDARTELLWSHAATAYWDTQLGVRHDSGIAPGRDWVAVGVQGLAPYWFEVDATFYAGDQGRTALRLSVEYELLMTQKLILQPRFEANFYGMKDEERETGSGLSNAVAGMRLRYEIRREFAPYIGVDWVRKFGETADYAAAAGTNTHAANVVAGLRVWF